MRQIVLDTETTGLEPSQGHRIIEIGAVELVNRRLSGSRFHQYLNPDREIEAGAAEVHGITSQMLADKPRFADVAAEFLAFVRGSELIIHNAPFDVGFINSELALMQADHARIEDVCAVLDTLRLARSRHPGQKNDLDSLCRRYHIDNSQRTLHGALLDAEILADVYLAMTGGQTALFQDVSQPAAPGRVAEPAVSVNRGSSPLRVVRPSTQELAAHTAWMDEIDRKSGGRCIWKKLLDGGGT